MKLALIAVAGLASVASAQSADRWSANTARPQFNTTPYAGGALVGTDATLWDNGPLATGATTLSGVAAPAGFLWSEVQNDSPTGSNTVAGFGLSGAFRMADDFTVPSGQTWAVDGFCTYGYSTGSAPGGMPVIGSTMNIWNGAPGSVGAAIIGTATFDASSDTNMYRVFNTVAPAPGTLPGTGRLIRQVDWNTSLSLGAGTYWIDYGHNTGFAPSVTIPGTRGLPGWNGLQFNGTTWGPALDLGNPGTEPDFQQDMPFIVKGQIPAPASLALLGLGGLIAGRRRR